MKVWAVINKNQKDFLEKNKVLYPLKKEIKKYWEGTTFLDSYNWLKEQLEIKGLNLKYNYPFWVWIERPDFREYRKEIPKGGSLFLLELDIPKEEIIISNFGAWHMVLNGIYCPKNTSDYKMIEKDKKLSEAYFWDKEIENNLKSKIKESWNNIFLRNKKFKNLYGLTEQGNISHIRLDQIIKITEYKKS